MLRKGLACKKEVVNLLQIYLYEIDSPRAGRSDQGQTTVADIDIHSTRKSLMPLTPGLRKVIMEVLKEKLGGMFFSYISNSGYRINPLW